MAWSARDIALRQSEKDIFVQQGLRWP